MKLCHEYNTFILQIDKPYSAAFDGDKVKVYDFFLFYRSVFPTLLMHTKKQGFNWDADLH